MDTISLLQFVSEPRSRSKAEHAAQTSTLGPELEPNEGTTTISTSITAQIPKLPKPKTRRKKLWSKPLFLSSRQGASSSRQRLLATKASEATSPAPHSPELLASHVSESVPLLRSLHSQPTTPSPSASTPSPSSPRTKTSTQRELPDKLTLERQRRAQVHFADAQVINATTNPQSTYVHPTVLPTDHNTSSYPCLPELSSEGKGTGRSTEAAVGLDLHAEEYATTTYRSASSLAKQKSEEVTCNQSSIGRNLATASHAIDMSQNSDHNLAKVPAAPGVAVPRKLFGNPREAHRSITGRYSDADRSGESLAGSSASLGSSNAKSTPRSVLRLTETDPSVDSSTIMSVIGKYATSATAVKEDPFIHADELDMSCNQDMDVEEENGSDKHYLATPGKLVQSSSDRFFTPQERLNSNANCFGTSLTTDHDTSSPLTAEHVASMPNFNTQKWNPVRQPRGPPPIDHLKTPISTPAAITAPTLSPHMAGRVMGESEPESSSLPTNTPSTRLLYDVQASAQRQARTPLVVVHEASQDEDQSKLGHDDGSPDSPLPPGIDLSVPFYPQFEHASERTKYALTVQPDDRSNLRSWTESEEDTAMYLRADALSLLETGLHAPPKKPFVRKLKKNNADAANGQPVISHNFRTDERSGSISPRLQSRNSVWRRSWRKSLDIFTGKRSSDEEVKRYSGVSAESGGDWETIFGHSLCNISSTYNNEVPPMPRISIQSISDLHASERSFSVRHDNGSFVTVDLDFGTEAPTIQRVPSGIGTVTPPGSGLSGPVGLGIDLQSFPQVPKPVAGSPYVREREINRPERRPFRPASGDFFRPSFAPPTPPKDNGYIPRSPGIIGHETSFQSLTSATPSYITPVTHTKNGHKSNVMAGRYPHMDADSPSMMRTPTSMLRVNPDEELGIEEPPSMTRLQFLGSHGCITPPSLVYDTPTRTRAVHGHGNNDTYDRHMMLGENAWTMNPLGPDGRYAHQPTFGSYDSSEVLIANRSLFAPRMPLHTKSPRVIQQERGHRYCTIALVCSIIFIIPCPIYAWGGLDEAMIQMFRNPYTKPSKEQKRVAKIATGVWGVIIFVGVIVVCALFGRFAAKGRM